MKTEIAILLKKTLKGFGVDLDKKEIENLIETPPSSKMGDYSFPCFFLAKKLRKNPNEIALKIKEKISDKTFEDIQTVGGYVNFFLNKKKFAEKVVKEVLTKKDKFGKVDVGKKEKIMIEFPSPNTNKPLHLGHLRNMSIGESLSRITEFFGNKVIRANLNNDRGIHICKSMTAYEKFGKNKIPNKKSDHFVGDYYVMFSKNEKKLEKQNRECLQKWEQGDKQTLELWKKMNKWALDGFKETYKKFGIKQDVEYFESKIYKKGKSIINDGLKKKIFYKKSDGAIAIDLGKRLGEKIVLRSDSTSVYITQDIYLAKLKYEKYKLDKSIYVVGNEQDYHFRVLEEILKRLKMKFFLKHLSHGMVNLTEGKMKSREGIVVDADNLIENIQNLVKKELDSRTKLSKKELELRSLKITLAAIKYFLLRVDSKKNMLFNPKESINFEGDTGPYLLYSYARASSILRKSKISISSREELGTKRKSKNKKIKTDFKIKKLNEKEIELVKKLSQFQEVVLNAHKILNPSLIANYSYELTQLFNKFYHTSKVIGSEKESFRLALVESFRYVLKNSMKLLGIEVIERM